MMKTPRLLCFLALGFLLALVSCSKPPARDDKIEARNDAEFEQWLSNHRDVIPANERKEIDEARQQLRYKVMTARPGLMSDAFAEALYAEINGRTVDEVLATSYDLQIERVEVELKNYAPMLARLETDSAKGYLTEDQKEAIATNLRQLREKIAQREEDLKRLNARRAELPSSPAPTS
ncbi:MAG: hypothetical protein NVV63_16305 [Opitutus sp.]|nr:hypothetical protein [Opitutus sp.]